MTGRTPRPEVSIAPNNPSKTPASPPDAVLPHIQLGLGTTSRARFLYIHAGLCIIMSSWTGLAPLSAGGS